MRWVIQHHLDEANESLRHLMARLQHLPMQSMGAVVASSVEDRIRESKTAPDGTAWASVAGKPRERILIGVGGVQSGLLGSILYQAGDNRVLVGSTMDYASYLQRGTRKMVARPFLGLSPADEQTILTMLQDWFNDD